MYPLENRRCISVAVLVRFCQHSSSLDSFALIVPFAGIGVFATCSTRPLVAYAEKSMHPNIYVFDFASKSVIATLPGGTSLEYSCLAFSRDGTWLAAQGSVPDYNMWIWEWEKEKALVKSPEPNNFPGIMITFNPRNMSQLCCSGNGRLTVFKLEKTFSDYELVGFEAQLTLDFDPISHCWMPDGRVLGANAAGALVLYDADRDEVEPFSYYDSTEGEDMEEGATTGDDTVHERVGWSNHVCLSQHHVVISGSDGCFRFISRATHEITWTIQSECLNISSMSFSNDYERLVIASKSGKISEIRILMEPTPDMAANSLPSPEPRLIGDFHSGAVTDVRFLNENTLVTAGTDGTIRLWNSAANVRSLAAALLCKVSFAGNPQVISLALHPSKMLLAAGCSDGGLRILDISEPSKATLVQAIRLHSGKITSLCWDTLGQVLASAGEDHLVFFCNTREGRTKVIGYSQVTHTPVCVRWRQGDAAVSSFLFCACEGGDIFRFVAPPEDYVADASFQLSNTVVAKSLLKTRYTAGAIVFQPLSMAGQRHALFAVTADRAIKTFTMMSETGDPELMDETDIVPPDAEYPTHRKKGTALAIAPSEDFLVSAGADGMVTVRMLDKLNNPVSVTRHSVFDGGIASLDVSSSSTCICTVGNDGLVAVWTLSGVGSSEAVIERAASGLPPSADIGEDEPTVLDSMSHIEQQKAIVQHREVKEKLMSDVELLRERFLALLERNKEVDELERLERKEFIIDQEEYEKLLAESAEAVQAVAEEVKFTSLGYQLIWDRIKKEMHESMDARQETLSSFTAPTCVKSIPIRKMGKAEETRLTHIRSLRRTEMIEEQKRGNELPTFMKKSFVIPNPFLSKTVDPAAGNKKKTEKHDAEPVDAGEPMEDEISDTINSLLYPPLHLISNTRKVTQIYLLQAAIEETKRVFNTEFQESAKAKFEEKNKIEDRNERIQSILSELKTEEPIFVLENDPTSEDCLNVDDGEVNVEKFVSPEELARIAEDARLAAERAAAARGDNWAERALSDMMDGKLDSATSENILDEEIVKPEWMNKPVEEMSNDEVKLVKEWEKKMQTMRDEREKYRKALMTELQKLQKQIGDGTAAFEARLAALQLRRLQADQVIFEYELYMIKLMQSLMRFEEEEERVQFLTAELAKLSKRADEAADAAERFANEHEEYARELEQLTLEDKAMEKQFRKDFADPDRKNTQDLEILWKLFRRRRKGGEQERVGSSAASQKGSEAGGRDPYGPALTVTVQKDAVEDEIDDSEKPEGLDPAVWDRFLDGRRAKIASEEEIKRRASVLDEMGIEYDRLQNVSKIANDECAEVAYELDELKSMRQMDLLNLEVLVKLKQGQVEVEQAAVVTDYADAVLINKRVVHKLNAQIFEKGGEKIAVLTDIKNFRKNIQKAEWELRRGKMEIEDLTFKFKDLQLLRVTKELQEMLKGGGESRHQQEIQLLERKREHARKTHVGKVDDKKSIIGKLEKKAREKKVETRKLASQVSELEVRVQERNAIYEVQAGKNEQTAAVGTTNTDSRMKELAAKRHLVDIAKAQAEEIEFLREELDRLRQRTFPSFVRVQKH